MWITVLTAMSEPPQRFGVFTKMDRQRSFTAAEKLAIVTESSADEPAHSPTASETKQPQS